MNIKILKIFCQLGFTVIVSAILVGCGQKQQGRGGPGGGATQKAQVIVDTVETDDVQLYMYVRGEMKQYKEVDVRARVSGFLEGLYFQSGGIIKKGAALALIEQDQYEVALNAAKADLEVSKARAALAKANLVRAKELVASKTIPEEEYESKMADYNVAVATVALAETSDLSNSGGHRGEIATRFS